MISILGKFLKNLYARVIDSYKNAQQNGYLPLWIVSAIAIYIPFEDFILKWFPLPLSLINLIRLIPELCLYILLFRIIQERIKSGKGIRITPIEPLIIAFFLAATVSIVVNGASLPGSIMNLRTNWRYLSVYYILVNIDISKEQIANLVEKIKIAGLIEAYIAAFQFFLPDGLTRTLFARAGTMAAQGTIKAGASFGTFSESANLSSFLLLITGVFFTSIYSNYAYLIPPPQDLAHIFVLFFALFASKKRAALLMALILAIIVLFHLRRRRNIAWLLWVGSLAGLIVIVLFVPLFNEFFIAAQSTEKVDLLSYFTEIFDPKYWEETASQSRGFVIEKVCRALVESGSWFGFGPSLISVYHGISEALNLNSVDQEHLWEVLYVFDDPYWFAILGYFGIVGILLYWLVLLRLYQASQTLVKYAIHPEYRNLGSMFSAITMGAYLYSFVERIFRLRAFSFYFWLLAGLVINALYVQEQQRQQQLKEQEINREQEP